MDICKKNYLKRERMESDNKNKMKEMNEKHKLEINKADITEKEQNDNYELEKEK